MVVPVNDVPLSPEGFYGINNQFLVSGPKGFVEFKTLENEDMYIRTDLPGVPNDGVRVFFDTSTKAICIFATAPKEHKYDFSHRSYDGSILRPKLSIHGLNTGIVCKCVDYSDLNTFMSDGVLRLILTKTRNPSLGGTNEEDICIAAPHGIPDGTDPQDPNLTGPVLKPHPGVREGSPMAYESKRLQNGGLYVRVDMPGVPKENFTVSVANGRVKVTGEAPALCHDSSGRSYAGDVAILSTRTDIPLRKIKTIAKNGVIRLTIPYA